MKVFLIYWFTYFLDFFKGILSNLISRFAQILRHTFHLSAYTADKLVIEALRKYVHLVAERDSLGKVAFIRAENMVFHEAQSVAQALTAHRTRDKRLDDGISPAALQYVSVVEYLPFKAFGNVSPLRFPRNGNDILRILQL